MKKLLFTLIALVLFLGGLEIALAITGYQGPPEYSLMEKDIRFAVSGELYGRFDPHRFWKLPNVEPRFSGDNPKIICLADSVTVFYNGKGYPELLPDALALSGYEKKVEVFNGGVPEYTSHQGLVYLRRELAREKPDIVIIQFGWNDHWKAKLGVADHKVRFPTKGQKARIHKFQNRLTYRLVRQLILSIRFSPRVPLEKYKENLVKMAEQVQRGGGKVILVAPVYLDGDTTWVEAHGIDIHKSYFYATREASRLAGAPFIDLQNVFGNNPDLFADPDRDPVHFNWDGAKIMADAIAKTLVENGLLP